MGFVVYLFGTVILLLTLVVNGKFSPFWDFELLIPNLHATSCVIGLVML